MQQAISTQDMHAMHNVYSTKEGLIDRFIVWCNKQEENRFLWLGIALMGSVCTVLPLTLLAIVFGADNNFTLWIIACIINVPVLILNLAVQPTKFILPVMFFAWLADVLIIAYCGAVFFNVV